MAHSCSENSPSVADEVKLARLSKLFDTYGTALYRCVLRIVRHHADAEDILQEVFAKMLLRSQLIDEDAPHIGSWLMAVARNLALDHLRSRGSILSRQVPLDDQYAIPGSTDANLITTENARLVVSAIRALRPRQKQVIELAYYSGLTQAQIAKRTHQPLGTVKGRTRAAMLQLQTILETQRNTDR